MCWQYIIQGQVAKIYGDAEETREQLDLTDANDTSGDRPRVNWFNRRAQVAALITAETFI